MTVRAKRRGRQMCGSLAGRRRPVMTGKTTVRQVARRVRIRVPGRIARHMAIGTFPGRGMRLAIQHFRGPARHRHAIVDSPVVTT